MTVPPRPVSERVTRAFAAVPGVGGWRQNRQLERRMLRLREYGKAMDWAVDPACGRITGEMAGWPVSAYEDEYGYCTIELQTPALLPNLRVEPRLRGPGGVIQLDDLGEVRFDDEVFDYLYEVRTDVTWLAHIMFSVEVRQALTCSPLQQIRVDGQRLIALGLNPSLDALDLIARITPLAKLMDAVPWEAFENSEEPLRWEHVMAVMVSHDLLRPRPHREQIPQLSRPD